MWHFGSWVCWFSISYLNYILKDFWEFKNLRISNMVEKKKKLNQMQGRTMEGVNRCTPPIPRGKFSPILDSERTFRIRQLNWEFFFFYRYSKTHSSTSLFFKNELSSFTELYILLQYYIIFILTIGYKTSNYLL